MCTVMEENLVASQQGAQPKRLTRSKVPMRAQKENSIIILSHPSRPPVTSHLMFSNRSIFITAQRLWNDLPPELLTISLPPPRHCQSQDILFIRLLYPSPSV